VRVVYADATGHIFLWSAAIAVISVIAAVLLPHVTLRQTLDVEMPESAVSQVD